MVDGGDGPIGEVDALLLVGKHDEAEMTLKGCYMAKM